MAFAVISAALINWVQQKKKPAKKIMTIIPSLQYSSLKEYYIYKNMQDEEKPILILFILTMMFLLTDSKCSLDSNFISVACV